MQKLIALFRKELLVLSKDRHGLLVLFVMPAVFILIMSLAMRDTFSERSEFEIAYLLLDEERSELSEEFIGQLRQTERFVHAAEEGKQTRGAIEQLVASDRYKFAVFIPEGFSEVMEQAPSGDAEAEPILPIEVVVSTSVTPQLQMLFKMTLIDALQRMRLAFILEGLLAADVETDDELGEFDLENYIDPIELQTRFAYQGDGQRRGQPTSVQQSVPAWLVFSMFFVVIPLSTAFIVERQQGSMLRLRVMNISPFSLIIGKIIPYYLVNLVQMILMLLVGIYLVPVFGGDRLDTGDSMLGIFIISSATSFAAINFALLITTVAKTEVQATTIGGISNLIFGAIGGIMVPKFVMPPFMRELADLSPMSWALEGYLDLFLRQADWQVILPEAMALFGFALIAFVLAGIFLSREL